jgi:hypothetical protein
MVGVAAGFGDFHAIVSRPVRWTGPEAGDWSPTSAADRDCGSELVSSLVISVTVKVTFVVKFSSRA